MTAKRTAAPSPSPVEHGVVTHLFPADDYGLLLTDDGRELPFYRDREDGEFDQLNLGAAVRFREVQSEEGPEAVDVVRAT